MSETFSPVPAAVVAAANQLPVAGVMDYRNAPLGSLPGEEHLTQPYNGGVGDAVVKVRNLSATTKRKIVREWVSFINGGEEQIKNGPYKGKAMLPEELQKRAARGQNANWEVEDIRPQDILITFDGRKYMIPAAKLNPENGKVTQDAPYVIVPAGVWDLYCGNWERMHDPKEKAKETERLRTRGYYRWVISEGNSYGFLEFTREEVVPTVAVVDQQRVASGQLVEI